DKVKITSFDHDNMHKFYEQSDILLYGRLTRNPSDDNAVSTKMLEYMSTGRPIILTENALSAISLLPRGYPLVIKGDCSDLSEKLEWLQSQDLKEFSDKVFDCALVYDVVNVGGVIASRFDETVEKVVQAKKLSQQEEKDTLSKSGGCKPITGGKT
ncbi:unnamed protein product, partial [marine sediment metagenome]